MTVTDVLRAGLVTRQASPAESTRRRSGAAATWLRAYTGVLVALDFVSAAAVGAALLAVVGTDNLPLTTAAALPAAWIAIAALSGAYRPNVLGAGAHDLRAVCIAGVFLFAVVPLVPLIGVDLVYDAVIAAGLAGVTLSAGATRWVARAVLTARRRKGRCTHSLYIAGDSARVIDMVERLRRTTATVVAVGIAVPRSKLAPTEHLNLPVIGFDDDLDTLDLDRILAAARVAKADGVLLAPGRGVDNEVLRRLGRACEWHGVPLFFAPSVVDVATSAPVIPVAGLPVLAMSRPGPAGAGQFTKNVVDRLGAGVGLALLAPLLLFTAVAIRLDSDGPALFRQTRVGRDGARFNMVKFRTMQVGAEELIDELAHLNESDGNTFKIREDPRLTRLGSVLRSFSIDELPQLWNVLTGRMSLVGPRPPLPSEVAAYTAAERRRLLVKPGMTGLWQVGGRSNLSWVDTVRLDLRYVDSWSLPLDARILARTLPEVLRRNGAF